MCAELIASRSAVCRFAHEAAREPRNILNFDKEFQKTLFDTHTGVVVSQKTPCRYTPHAPTNANSLPCETHVILPTPLLLPALLATLAFLPALPGFLSLFLLAEAGALGLAAPPPPEGGLKKFRISI